LEKAEAKSKKEGAASKAADDKKMKDKMDAADKAKKDK